MIFDPVETLAKLVSIPSVNPMGGQVSGPTVLETRLTDHLESVFRRLGLAVFRQPVEPGRENLIARLDGDLPAENGGRLVLFDAHQDTVPVGGMTIDPFWPDIRDGRLYGRGACDTKGGMAAMMAAASRLAAERPRNMPTLVVSCTVNEENGFTGASALPHLWEKSAAGIIPRRPDVAIVAEPTDLNVVVAHKGVVRWRCRTSGRAVHSARPETGVNAIYRMARVVAEIERYAQQRVAAVASHPLCGPATLSVGTICGGVGVNTVPDRCTIEIDRRLPPGETPEDARGGLIDYLEREVEFSFAIEHDPAFMQGLALSDVSNGPLAEELTAVVREVVGQCNRVGVPYATNAAYYAAAGVPSVVFGPGSIDQAHTQDEWLPLDELQQATEVFYRLVRST